MYLLIGKESVSYIHVNWKKKKESSYVHVNWKNKSRYVHVPRKPPPLPAATWGPEQPSGGTSPPRSLNITRRPCERYAASLAAKFNRYNKHDPSVA